MTKLGIELLTSFKNPRVQQLRSLLSQKETRTDAGAFVTEGIRLGEEVLNSGVIPKTVFYTSNVSSRGKDIIDKALHLGVEGFELTPEVMSRVSETETSQGVLMIVPQDLRPLPPHPNLVLVLDQLRDPGNAGTILRSAAAAGVEAVLLTPGTVDLYMPKVVRSAMGAHFHLCIHQMNWMEIETYCRHDAENRLQILLADSSAGSRLWETDLKTPLALVIGGEAEGASREVCDAADSRVHIPMPGQFESLNAGVAASILLFEILRQRSL